jgi:hypothetical protein
MISSEDLGALVTALAVVVVGLLTTFHVIEAIDKRS